MYQCELNVISYIKFNDYGSIMCTGRCNGWAARANNNNFSTTQVHVILVISKSHVYMTLCIIML